MDENVKKEMQDAISEALKGLTPGLTKAEVTAIVAEQTEKFKNLVSEEKLKQFSADMQAEIAKINAPKETEKTAKQQIVDSFKELGINTVKELNAYLVKNGNLNIEVKSIASTDNTDTVGRTNLDPVVRWSPTRANVFLGDPGLRVVAEDNNKSRFGYVEGSYTGTAGYVGEGTGNSSVDSASASATFGVYAKVQAIQSVDEEVYEDIPSFADGLLNQMQISASKFVDDELLTGDGLAPASIQHIKGFDAYATEFDTTDYIDTVIRPTTADLIAAMATEISMEDGGYIANRVYMHPLDLYKLQREKDTDGNPVVLMDAFGNPTMGGIRVVKTKKVTANTLYVMDLNVGELRTKRSMTLQAGKILTDDFKNDKRSAILSARYQLLVRTLDAVAVLKCSNIATALAAIEKPVVAVSE